MQTIPNERRTLLVINDAVDSRKLIHNALSDIYKVEHANNSAHALNIAQSDNPPDLILLDVTMSDMDGYEVCRRLKETPKTQNIPVIFVMTESNPADEEKGFALGAVDFITKPISPPIVKARVKTHLALKDSRHSSFQSQIKQSVANVVIKDIFQEYSSHTLQDVSIFAIASLAEPHEYNTGNHIRRTQQYVKVLAENLLSQSLAPALLTPSDIALLYKSAPLHDIGKLHLPPDILKKTGQLTADDFNTMKQHTILGCNAIDQAEKICGVDGRFLRFAKEIALSHHERWDGSGYPQGLKENEIPLSARLMALADVYDALISHKTDKIAVSHAEAIDIIYAGKNNLFDPDIVDSFMKIEKTIQSITAHYSD